MIPKSPLDDPQTAAFAWARFRRLMWFMMAVTLGTLGVAFTLLYQGDSPVSIHFYIATALGITFMMLLTAALMGLSFLSSGTGHDEAVTDLMDDDRAR